MNAIRYCLCILLAGSVLLGGAAVSNAATFGFQLKNQGVNLQNADVTLFLGYGTEQGRTNADGQVTIQVQQGRGFWIEVNGARLNRFYLINAVPAVIDVAQVGTMTWQGGK